MVTFSRRQVSATHFRCKREAEHLLCALYTCCFRKRWDWCYFF